MCINVRSRLTVNYCLYIQSCFIIYCNNDVLFVRQLLFGFLQSFPYVSLPLNKFPLCHFLTDCIFKPFPLQVAVSWVSKFIHICKNNVFNCKSYHFNALFDAFKKNTPFFSCTLDEFTVLIPTLSRST